MAIQFFLVVQANNTTNKEDPTELRFLLVIVSHTIARLPSSPFVTCPRIGPLFTSLWLLGYKPSPYMVFLFPPTPFQSIKNNTSSAAGAVLGCWPPRASRHSAFREPCGGNTTYWSHCSCDAISTLSLAHSASNPCLRDGPWMHVRPPSSRTFSSQVFTLTISIRSDSSSTSLNPWCLPWQPSSETPPPLTLQAPVLIFLKAYHHRIINVCLLCCCCASS